MDNEEIIFCQFQNGITGSSNIYALYSCCSCYLCIVFMGSIDT